MNSERKEEFLNEIYTNEETLRVWTNIFTLAERAEDRFNKDLSEFSNDEIEEMLEDYDSITPVFLDRTVKLFNRYTGWCIEHGYRENGNNNYSVYEFQDMARFVRPIELYSEVDILRMCQELENPIDRFLVAAPFFGFRHTKAYIDITSVTREDINKEECTIQLVDRVISVPEWFINLTLETMDTYVYTAIPNSLSNNRVQTYNLYGSGIIKYRVSDLTDIESVTFYISNKFRRKISVAFGFKISYMDIFKSGCLYRSKKIMLEEKIDNFDELWNNATFRKDVKERYQITRKQFYEQYNVLLKERA